MPGDDDILLLVERIYDAAVDPERWPAFLEALAAGYPGGQGVLYRVDQERASVLLAGWDPAWTEVHNAYYHATNPWLPGMRARPAGVTTTAEEFTPWPAFRRTEYYNDFLRPQGIGTGVGATIMKEHGRVMGVSVLFQQENGEPAGPRHVRRLARLVPHLTRAQQINQALAYASLARQAAAHILDRIAIGAVVTDAAGRLLFANGSAERILKRQDGLALRRDGAIEAAYPAVTEQLRALIAAAARTAAGTGLAPGGALALPRPSERPGLCALVAPLRLVPDLLGLAREAALVLVADPSQPRRTEAAVLKTLFGLTPAEARTAAALASGESVADIALRARVQENTVRQQLKAIYAKTGTRRQGELVHLVLRLGPIMEAGRA